MTVDLNVFLNQCGQSGQCVPYKPFCAWRLLLTATPNTLSGLTVLLMILRTFFPTEIGGGGVLGRAAGRLSVGSPEAEAGRAPGMQFNRHFFRPRIWPKSCLQDMSNLVVL